MNPKISIIIPSFNQGKYIEQTIVSIIEQSYKNVEIIIIDAASTDETLAVIKKYEPYIVYWVCEPDRGQAHAINKGLAKCTGEVFNWLNSDDYLEPGALNEIAAQFATNQHIHVLCGYTRCFWHEDKRTSHEYRMGVKKTAAETIYNVEMNQPGSFYKTNIVREFGGVNESLRYVFDDELWFRYLCKYGIKQVGFSEKRLAQFRLHDASKSIGEGFDLFNTEISELHLDILRDLHAPSWLTDLLQENTSKAKYVSSGKWDTSALENEKFITLFAAKFINTLYLQGNKKEAKEAMSLTIKQGLFKWNRMMTSLRMKLFLN